MFHQLEVTYDFDFSLWGISCHEKIYRLAWLLNKQHGFQFQLDEDIKVMSKSGCSVHLNYTMELEDQDMKIHLLQNRAEGAWILPEYKHIDYLIKLDADGHAFDEKLTEIRKSPHVLAGFKLDAEGLKNKENLLFD
ncbi:MAG: IPExxxVDY family protein [Bacteroidota bacterium]